MLTNKSNESGLLNINQLEDTAMNMVENFCAVICRPVELILRPQHGSRYFSVVVIFFSTAMMIFLPIVSAVTTSMISLIPFAHVSAPVGLFGVGSLAKLYFLLSFIHSIRIYRRMIHPELEEHSQFEGPPLPFFYLLHKSGSFWFTRTVLEPAVVLFVANVLGHLFIFQSGLVTFLQFSAFALGMKGFIGWYRGWEYIRNILDIRYAGPIIAKLADNSATDSDLAPIHMASFPKNLPADIRRAAISHIARVFSPDEQASTASETNISQQERTNHESHPTAS